MTPQRVLTGDRESWRLEVLGHVALWDGTAALPLFHKGLALVTYLVLEGRAHHREHLAGLLWETPDALGNLRVELLRLRQRGVGLPPRQPLLALRCRTDLDDWAAVPDDFGGEHEVLEWLSALRGLPLSGLEDLGTTAFREWLDSQRAALLDRIETRLARAASRLAGRGDWASVRLITGRAGALGLNLGLPEPAPAPLPLWSAQQAQWQEVLRRAQQRPQVAFVRGEAGTRRLLLAALAEGGAWQTLKVHADNGGALCQTALKLQLRRLLPAGAAAAVPRRPEPESLVEITELLGAAAAPLLLILHDPPAQDRWWTALVSAALDLPGPLAVVVTAPPSGPALEQEHALGPLLRRVAGPRLHVISLPPLGVEEVSELLRPRLPERTPALDRDVLATRLAQCSEGSLPYLQALLERDPPAPDLRLPAQASEVLLSGLASRTPSERWALAHLAQIYGPVTPELAAALLGEAAQETLALGVRLGLLVPVAASERLSLPDLGARVPDGAATLGFSRELLRCALAATLPAPDRDARRRDLARFLLPTEPSLSLLYARRVGDTALEAQARAALPAQTPLSHAQGPVPQAAAAPACQEHPRREHRTPGGYRVISEGGLVRVLRRGHPGPAPSLVLTFAAQSPRSVTVRADVLPGAPRPDQWPPQFALGLRTGEGPRRVYAAGPVPTHEAEGVSHVFAGTLPVGRWLCLSLAEPLTELSVRAGHVALTLAGAGLTAPPAPPP